MTKILSIEDMTAELDKVKGERTKWHNAWYESRSLAGKMYWDGAQVGYVWGMSGKNVYDLDARVHETARDISILIANFRVSSEIAMQELLDRLEPLTFYVIKYNTGDQILFQCINGNPIPMRIKTHDGLFMDESGLISKLPQAQLFDKDAAR